jgi:aldose 1-epimerase
MTKIVSKPFGTTKEGISETLYSFTNINGCEVSVCNYGGTIVSIKVPDRDGKFADVVLGYDDLDGYISRKYFFGAAIGRCCNRIGSGKFALNGKFYQLNCNDGRNHLHGGLKGFDTAEWDCAVKSNELGDFLVLHHVSPDGDENYPGRLDVTMTYSFNDKNELTLNYQAVSDEDTICNLTNHTYFNLAGHDSGSILEHEVKIYADNITEADNEGIPTGKIVSVKDTPMDFREFHTVGERIDSDYYQLGFAGGYDHNWVLNKDDKKLGVCAEIYDRKSGRHLTCFTTSPCVQFYTANYIAGDQKGKCEFAYGKRSGMCFETQFAPDAINQNSFVSSVLKAKDKYDETTVYRFDVK